MYPDCVILLSDIFSVLSTLLLDAPPCQSTKLTVTNRNSGIGSECYSAKVEFGFSLFMEAKLSHEAPRLIWDNMGRLGVLGKEYIA